MPRTPVHRGLAPAHAGIIALILVLSGCSVLKTEFGTPLPEHDLNRLETGHTTRATIMHTLGPPLAVAPYGRGSALLYEYLLITERQLGFGLSSIPYLDELLIYLKLFKAAIGNGSAEHSAALLLFDQHGILINARSGSWDEVIGRGGSLQLLITNKGVLGIEAYTQPPLSINWGGWMLAPLPEAQNQRYRSLIELRGTPVNNGQRTLELIEEYSR